ncbi:SNF2 family N-terminal domain-containing protein [Powellomyces hirtus]|nr:SNF2 family N-terminal domain-containing protein [Powellomyces hirtus]
MASPTVGRDVDDLFDSDLSSESVAMSVDGENDSAEEYHENGSAAESEKIFSDESSASEAPRPQKRKVILRKNSMKKEFEIAEANPDLYGLRRSGRARITPDRLTLGSRGGDETSESDISDDDYGSRKKKAPKKGRLRSRAEVNRNRKEIHQDFTASFSDPEEDSGSDFESAKAKKRRQRRSPTWEDDIPRYSTRQRNPALTYNEDDENDSEDDRMDVVEESPAQDTGPSIDGFWDTKTREDGETLYLVKWTGRSFRELEWCTLSQLDYMKGLKKLDKFLKDREDIQMQLDDPYITDEDRERLLMEVNDRMDILEDHKKVDRIIKNKVESPTGDNPSGISYLVKWCGVGYEEATWETATSLTDDQADIDKYLDRSNSRNLPDYNSECRPSHRRPFQPFMAQTFLRGENELRMFQNLGVNWAAELWHKNQNGILADEMGLGKTVQTVSLLAYLFHVQNVYGPHLVVVPLGTITAWSREFAKWAPDMNVVTYQGNSKGRAMIREHEFYTLRNRQNKPPKKILAFNVILTTYEMIITDKAYLSRIPWCMLAVDEAHRLKNEASKLHQALAKEYTTANRFLLTGTPLQNNIQELMALIQFLRPDLSLDMKLEIDLDATDNADQQSKIQYLHQLLKPITMRRMKKEVETSLPGKSEKMLRIPMTDSQRALYQAIYTKNLSDVKNGSQEAMNISLQNIVMQLKKASNSTWLFPNCRLQTNAPRSEMFREFLRSSGKMQILDQLLTRFAAQGHRVLIFSQMVTMLNLLADYLVYKGMQFQRLDGTVPSEARKRAMDHFNAPGSTDFAFLLSTRAGGLGLNLETADTVILFDQDWNPQNDLQAIARAHRIGQKNTVQVFRFITADTVEEEIVERAKRKMVLEYAVIHQMEGHTSTVDQQKLAEELKKPGRDELATILKFGAKKLFSQKADNGTDANSEQEKVDLDEILAKAETTDLGQAQGGLGASEEFMERWKTLNIEMDQVQWDSLITATEEQKAQADALLKDTVPATPLPKKKTATRPSYAEEEDEEDEKVAAKQKKGGKPKPRKNAQTNTLDKKAAADLANALMTWGDMDRKFKEIVSQANLTEKTEEAVIKAAQEIIELCENAVREHDKALGHQATKAEKEKAIFIEYKGAKDINARKMVERLPLMKALISELKSHKNILSYRIDQTDLGSTQKWDSKPSWNTRDDSMLIVGMYRHGFGNWRVIQADEELGFERKFHLGGERSSDSKDKLLPKKLHLDRRALYLLKEIKTRQEEYRASRDKSTKKRDRGSVGAEKPTGVTLKLKIKKDKSQTDESALPKIKIRDDATTKLPNFRHKTPAEQRKSEDAAQDDGKDLFKGYHENNENLEKYLKPHHGPLAKLVEPVPSFNEKCDYALYIKDLMLSEFMPVARALDVVIDEEKVPTARERLRAQLFRYMAENHFFRDEHGGIIDWRMLLKWWTDHKHDKPKVIVSPTKHLTPEEIMNYPSPKLRRRRSSSAKELPSPPRDNRRSSSDSQNTGQKRRESSDVTSTPTTIHHDPPSAGYRASSSSSAPNSGTKRRHEDEPSDSAPVRPAKKSGGILDGYKIPKKPGVVIVKERSPSQISALDVKRKPQRSRSRSRSRSKSPDRRRNRDYEGERDRRRSEQYRDRERERERDRDRDHRRGDAWRADNHRDRSRERGGRRFSPYRR